MISYTPQVNNTKDSTDARIERDASDLSKISTKLISCSPFSSDPSLRNIINGLVAKEDVDVHEYESVGRNIIERMIGQPVFTFSFKRKDKAKILGNPFYLLLRLLVTEPLILAYCSSDSL